MLKIAVIGLGKLGLCTALCLKRKYDVIGIDSNEATVNKINNKISPIEEPQVSEMLEEMNFEATTDYDVIKKTDVSFIIVPTPTKKDGSFDCSYVKAVVKEICKRVKRKHIINVVSTINPGFMNELNIEFKNNLVDFIYNPEFIALGTVIENFLNPDVVLIGQYNDESGKIVENIYRKVCANSPTIHRIKMENAEIAKIALNSYITMKITFVNILAEICEKIPNGDIDEITRVLGTDKRIGNKFFKGGLSYGGPCFPRDNKAFFSFINNVLVTDFNLKNHYSYVTDSLNNYFVARVYRKILDIFEDDIAGRKITIFGTSYKMGTSITEESAMHKIANDLKEQGADIVICNEPKNKPEILNALRDSELAIFGLPYEILKTLEIDDLNKAMKFPRVMDCWRVNKKLKNEIYYAIGLAE